MPRLWTIRDETLAALDRRQRERFFELVSAHLARELPQIVKPLDRRELRRALERGVAAAAELGFETEAEAAGFLELWMASSEDVEGRWPWAGPILRNTELSAQARLEQIQLIRS